MNITSAALGIGCVIMTFVLFAKLKSIPKDNKRARRAIVVGIIALLGIAVLQVVDLMKLY